MEMPSQEEIADHISMPIPLNSTYGGGGHHHHHMQIHHHHESPSHIDVEDTDNNHSIVVPFKKPPPPDKYKECLKNHAASMGGNATDGCGEFMPSGEEGTLEALTCSACACHRNFHRKQTEGDPDINHNQRLQSMGRRVFLGGHHGNALGYHISAASRAAAHQYLPMNMMGNYNNNNMGAGGSSDEMDGGGTRAKKRFRTKFSQEQKEKMQRFAERVGWKIQKQEESVVQQFCEEVGVKRRVFKVWMHNNKHTLANKNIITLPNSSLNHQNLN